MRETAALARLAAEVRTADATRSDPAGRALLATVRELPAETRFATLETLSFFDQATIASLFAQNVRAASKQTELTRTETRNWRREMAAVARFITRQSFSPLYLSGTQETLDRFKHHLQCDPDFYDAVQDWKTLSFDQKDQVIIKNLTVMLGIMNDTYNESMPMPSNVIADFKQGDGDLGGCSFDPQTGQPMLKFYFRDAPYGPFGRLACGGHELRHGMQVHRGLKAQFDKTQMVQADHNILRVAAHNYGLYLPYGTYGKYAYRRQATEVEAFMDTKQIYQLSDAFYDGVQPRQRKNLATDLNL